MVLTKVEITNFRNLADLSLHPGPGLNILVGENAQGKTNFIEALNLLISTKSFKAGREAELISWGEEFSRLFASADANTLEIIIRPSLKEITLNNLSTRAIDTVGVINGVLFTPADIEMLRDSPSTRRRFLDILISKINRKYLFDLTYYTHALKNRNKLLFYLRQRQRGFYDGDRDLDKEIKVWDEQVIEYGSKLSLSRFGYLTKLNKLLQDLGLRMIGYPVEINHLTKLTNYTDLETLTREFRETLNNSLETDVEKMTTGTGPHRDDFRIMAKTKDRKTDLGVYGSRGELRSTILALKIAELEITQEEKKDKAIILLDDVLSELDVNHQHHILELINSNQTFITTTTLEHFPKILLDSAKIFKVELGNIKLV